MSACLPARVYAHGFSWRKRAILRRFVAPAAVAFVADPASVPVDGTLLVWGSAQAPAGLASGVRVVRVEDGFLRSVGLGAAWTKPLSWVIDGTGIYYDASRPSDLETILQAGGFSALALARAARLRQCVVESRLTKYNVGHSNWKRESHMRRVILVPGQVESDAAIRMAAPGVRTNLALLKEVRASNPDAWILYKPHPDVVAGLRASGKGEHEAATWCDTVVRDVSMADLLVEVDEVHVLTSLTGFEALLRGKRVTCHGQPFYAGWGLTTDLHPVARRRRQITLDELVAGALIEYPTYIAHGSGAITTPEQALGALIQWRASASTGWFRSCWRRTLEACLSIQGRTR
jgi:capsular polysaccharide export protein